MIEPWAAVLPTALSFVLLAIGGLIKFARAPADTDEEVAWGIVGLGSFLVALLTIVITGLATSA